MKSAKLKWRMVWLLLGALLLSACGSVRLPQSPLLATFERKSGLIAFVGLDGNIYTMNQAGENMVAITENAEINDTGGEAQTYFYPMWAPDGDQLAFVGYHQPAGGAFEATLYTVKSDGSDLAEVYSSEESVPFYLYWGPNSDRVGFLSSSAGGGGMALQIAPASGGESVMVQEAQPFYWAWAPDGDALIAHTGGPVQDNPDNARMWHYSMETDVVRMLEMAPSFFQAPAFSADGEYFVAAVLDRTGQDSLVLVSADGRTQTELVQIEERVAFDWAPGGDRLAYITGRSTTVGLIGKLEILDLRDVNDPEIIETDAEEVMAFFWSPDGDKLAYFKPGLIENEDGENTLVMRVATMNARNGESNLLATIRPPEAFMSQIVPYYDQYQRSATIWSPDGRNLVINALTADNQPGIFIVPADGGIEPRFVEYGTMAFWSWK